MVEGATAGFLWKKFGSRLHDEEENDVDPETPPGQNHYFQFDVFLQILMDDHDRLVC